MLTRSVWYLTVAMIAYCAPDPGAVLKGVVTDNSGAVIPGASVSLTGSSVQKSTLTQSYGDYTFTGLNPGAYTVKVAYSEHRYNVIIGVNVINLLNHFNPTGYVGTLTSPLFGQPTAVNTGFGGGSLGSYGGLTANNRRLDFSIRFTF